MAFGGLRVSAQIVSLDLARAEATCGYLPRYRLTGEPANYSAEQISCATKFLRPLRIEILS